MPTLCDSLTQKTGVQMRRSLGLTHRQEGEGDRLNKEWFRSYKNQSLLDIITDVNYMFAYWKF